MRGSISNHSPKVEDERWASIGPRQGPRLKIFIFGARHRNTSRVSRCDWPRGRAPLSTQLSTLDRESLKTRISQRHKEELSGVLQYLHKPAFNDEEEFQLFSLPSQIIIRKQLKKIIERLNADENYCKNTYSNTENESEPKIEEEPLTLKEKFQQQIEKRMQVIKPETQKLNDLMSILGKEMALFESVGKRGHHLDLTYQYLMSIPPTSVESERAFSAAGCIETKIRSQLGDATLDELLFLRSYFQNQRTK